MAYVERRQTTGKDASGRTRRVTRYRVRYRDPGGKQHCETLLRAVDAERRRADIELELANSAWRDPRQGDIRLDEWAASWLPTRHDLRSTTWARLEGVMRKQVLPHFGRVQLNKITNGNIRRWVTELLDSGLSPATVRKAVFGLRQCLAAAVADGRLSYNPALQIPLPSERQKPARFLSRAEVERLVDATPSRYQALVLVGAYAGLRWGEAVGLRRQDIDLQRSRIRVTHTAVELRGVITLDNPPEDDPLRSVGAGRTVGDAQDPRTPRLIRRQEQLRPGVHHRRRRTALPIVRANRVARRSTSGWPRAPDLPQSAAQLRGHSGGCGLQRAGSVGVGRPQQCRVHTDPVRRPVRRR